MNADVTITSDQYLGIAADYFVITRYNFINYGTFVNAGTFCTTKNFTNNGTGTFDNSNTGFTLNLFGGILNFYDTRNVYNRGKGNIINFGTYTYTDGRGVIIGNPIRTLNPELSQFFKNQLPRMNL
jgi:hypothetical protein